jgi:hypothetical protein
LEELEEQKSLLDEEEGKDDEDGEMIQEEEDEEIKEGDEEAKEERDEVGVDDEEITKTMYKVLIAPYTLLDWQITLSQNDFPWYSVMFGNFSARDCYEKYTQHVKDAESFYKKILSGKEKYLKFLFFP